MSINNLMDDLEMLADRAAFKSGAIHSCPIHPEVWISSGDSDAERKAYAYMTNLIKDEFHGLEWREQAMEAVKLKLVWAADECPHCESLFRD